MRHCSPKLKQSEILLFVRLFYGCSRLCCRFEEIELDSEGVVPTKPFLDACMGILPLLGMEAWNVAMTQRSL